MWTSYIFVLGLVGFPGGEFSDFLLGAWWPGCQCSEDWEHLPSRGIFSLSPHFWFRGYTYNSVWPSCYKTFPFASSREKNIYSLLRWEKSFHSVACSDGVSGRVITFLQRLYTIIFILSFSLLHPFPEMSVVASFWVLWEFCGVD